MLNMAWKRREDIESLNLKISLGSMPPDPLGAAQWAYNFITS